MIRLKCTGCGAALRIPDNKAGKKGRCPHCGLVLFGLGDLCLCVRDIAMNAEAARRRQ